VPEPVWYRREAQRTLGRLGPRLAAGRARRDPAFDQRLERHFPTLFALLHELYGDAYDFLWHLERMLTVAADASAERPERLRALDLAREADPLWFQRHDQIGAVAYVDRFAGTLAGLRERIPHLRSLGVTYLHLMPLFRCPAANSDGGYAVSSYREVDPRLGTMAELAALAEELRGHGIALVLDFILNHTSDEHPWAQAAARGDPDFQAFYFMFDDRTVPAQYLPMLREIFPDRGGDAFSWRPDVLGPNGGKWVWTTFYPFQWDLNYRNPAVLTAMLGEMLFLANQGVEVLRLDAVPFLWKTLGTTCENQPQAHRVVRALNAFARIAAPALVFKSEAIVHPDDVVSYVAAEESQLSYHPLFMVLLWDALATRDTRHLRYALETRFRLPPGTAWVNYVRCHDDIGWGFADEDAARLGVNGQDHRQFLNAFYTGRFSGSFARGLPFQENPRTGDCRICGTLASLAGLEKALDEGDPQGVEHAIRRILLVHGLIMTLGGLPLLYLGDEIAQLNDYGYRLDEATAADARWVHRGRFDETRLARAESDPQSPEGRVLAGLRRLAALRRAAPALDGLEMRPVTLDERRLVAFLRHAHGRHLLVIGNLTEHEVTVSGVELARHLGPGPHQDLIARGLVEPGMDLLVGPYHLLVLEPVALLSPVAPSPSRSG
jgi:amylosucrase